MKSTFWHVKLKNGSLLEFKASLMDVIRRDTSEGRIFQMVSLINSTTSDKIFQHIILKQIKPTFPYVMNPNCYHLQGPSGVKVATRELRKIIEEEKPNFVIRADIKSSIVRYRITSLFKILKRHMTIPS